MANIVEIIKGEVFQENNLVLTDVNLTIAKGDFLYLIGKTGSGKTSFMKMLYAELKFVGEQAIVAGFPLKTLKFKNIPDLRKKIGIVFQDFQLLSDRNVGENLSFVLEATGWKNKKTRIERIQDVLNKVGLQNKSYKMPFELSGGEQQRVAIARALLNNPELILADEPTGNLDPETSLDIMRILLEINKEGKTLIIATHDYGLIEKHHARIYKCEGGRLREFN